jgi:hypothetical protein
MAGIFKTWKGRKQESLRPGRGKKWNLYDLEGKWQESLRPGREKNRNL